MQGHSAYRGIRVFVALFRSFHGLLTTQKTHRTVGPQRRQGELTFTVTITGPVPGKSVMGVSVSRSDLAVRR